MIDDQTRAALIRLKAALGEVKTDLDNYIETLKEAKDGNH